MSIHIIPKKDLPITNSVKISDTVIRRINAELKRLAEDEVVSLGFIIYQMSSREARAIVKMLKNAGYDCNYIKEERDENGIVTYDHDIEVFLN